MKNRQGKKIVAFITLVVFVAGLLSFSSYAGPAMPRTDSAKNVFLYHVDSDKVLYEKNADEKIAPLSTARMMAALILIEKLKDRLDETVVISQQAINTASQNRLKPYTLKLSEEIKVRDLLYAVIMSGAADATRALVLHVSDSIGAFTELMNSKAKELGMNDTLYNSPEGINDGSSYTTAKDVAKLALYAQKDRIYSEIAATQRYFIPKTNKAEEREIHTTNYLISKWIFPDYYMSTVTGLNAGDVFTDERCVVATATIGNYKYLCVSMGGVEFGQYVVTKALLNWASQAFEYKTLLSGSIIVGELPVKNAAKNDYVAIVPEKTIEAFLSVDADTENGITFEYDYTHKSLRAPVREGEVVGKIIAYYNGEKIGETNLVTKYGVSMGRMQFVFSGIRNILFSWWFILIVIITFLGAIGYVLLVARIRYLSSPKINIRPAPKQSKPIKNNIKNQNSKNIGGRNEKDGS